MPEILHNNHGLETDMKDVFKPGYFYHIYSADIHVSTIISRSTTETMDKVSKLNEQRKKLSNYMRSWIYK